MRKTILLQLLFLVFCLSSPDLLSQKNNNVIISDDKQYKESNSSNVLLDVHSLNGDKGVILPSSNTQTLINLYTDSANDAGLLFYNEDTSGFTYYDGSRWQVMANLSNFPKVDTSLFINVKEFGVKGDGKTDDSDSLQAVVDRFSGRIIFFPEGTYKAHLTINKSVILKAIPGSATIKWNKKSDPVLLVKAACTLDGIHIKNKNEGYGLKNKNKKLIANNCIFEGYQHQTTGNSSQSEFANCIFITNNDSIGSKCSSPAGVFTGCRFTGEGGANINSGNYYNCIFDAKWGVTLPEGKLDNSMGSTGLDGDAAFYNCVIKGSESFGLKAGNDAHPKLYNCTVIGYEVGVYLRSNSTVYVSNSHIEATKTTGAAGALKIVKSVNAEGGVFPIEGSGDSYFNNTVFTGGQYHLIIPDKDSVGSATFNECIYDENKVCVDNGTCDGKFDLYGKILAETTVFQDEKLTNGDIIEIKYSVTGTTYLNVQGDGAKASNIKFNKLYNGIEFPLGYQLIVRSASTANSVTLKHGYDVGIATALYTSAEKDLELMANDVAVFVYANNIWQEITPNNLGGGQSGGASNNGEAAYQNLTPDNNAFIEPDFSSNLATYLNVSGNGAAVSGIRFSKYYGSTEFPLGYTLIIRCGSDVNTVTLKNGYDAANGVGLYMASGSNLKMGANDVAVFRYTNNMWTEITPSKGVFYDNSNNITLKGGMTFTSGQKVSEFSNDESLTDNSPQKVPTQYAVKSYVDSWVKIQNYSNLGGDQSLTDLVPAGYKIASVVAEEKSGSNIQNFKIGTSSGSDNVCSSVSINANDATELTRGKTFFSTSSDQVLYISSDNWNSGIIDLYIKIEKVTN